MAVSEPNDDLVMSLVEQTLARPSEEREEYLQTACAGDTELISQVQEYVKWEERMNGFLLDPLFRPQAEERPFEPGQILDRRFRIVRKVAEGGMGVVYEAVDEKLERRIAIKCAKTVHRKRLPPEVRHASEISHPNVCKIFEIHTASTERGETEFLTMEFLEGETLAERLRQGPIPQPEALLIAQQLCAGLAEAHRKLVIHGDLKSGNVILTKGPDGATRAVITDFGLARGPEVAQRSIQSGELTGTPDYMAPELWGGERASVASDLYALGVILYELASGRRPYPPEMRLQDRLTRKPAPLSSKWNRVVARCLDIEPAGRYRNADEIAEALAATHSRRWLLPMAAIAFMVVAAGAVTYQNATAPQGPPRVAVVPFANIGRTVESQYLSDGISEGLINALAQLPDLKVIARSSSFQFKGDGIDVRKVARTLGAQRLVTGRVEQKDGRVRITAELVNGADGMQIWGGQYNSGVSNLPRTQSEISREIAQRVNSKLTETDRLKLAKATNVNPEAYELLLRGRYQMRLYSPESTQKAVGYYEQALAVDPGFAIANSELAYTYRLLSGSAVLSPSEMMPKAEAAALRALALDPNLAEAHAALADIRKDQWNWPAAEHEYRRAIELSPNLASARDGFAIYLSVMGRFDEAIQEIERTRELDPIGIIAAVDVGAVYYNARRYGKALEALKHAVELDPTASVAWLWTGIVYGGSGDFGNAIQAYEKAMRWGDNTTATQCLYAYSLARSGRRDQALHILDQLRQRQAFVPPSALAFIYAGLNDKESAMRLLEEAYAARDPLLEYMTVESHYDILNDDSRFRDLAARIGLPHERYDTIATHRSNP